MVTPEKKDKLLIIKGRFELEKERGDIAEAGRRAGVSGTTVSHGLNREKYADLKDGERKALLQLMRILNNRRAEELKLESELN